MGGSYFIFSGIGFAWGLCMCKSTGLGRGYFGYLRRLGWIFTMGIGMKGIGRRYQDAI